MQTLDARLLHNELLTGIEHFQPGYGLNSVPMPPEQGSTKAAEVIVGFINGNRSHPIVIRIDDRRYRPKNWNPGDVGLYHYQGATAKLTTVGWSYDAGDQKKPHTTTIGNAVVTVADGKIMGQVGGPSGPAFVVKDDCVYLGGDPDQGGDFEFVQTVVGPSSKVKAKL